MDIAWQALPDEKPHEPAVFLSVFPGWILLRVFSARRGKKINNPQVETFWKLMFNRMVGISAREKRETKQKLLVGFEG
ncbi:hypothetical protein RUM43_002751 [Polyplax serrata]|uniref:Uncharacterized protein n=1 Tax=Polyplax serrata TaxID=468196 RepID=A0AAN8NU21_POLSC